MYKPYLLMTLSTLFLFSCQSTDKTAYIEPGTVKRPCEKLNGLINAHENGFEALRTNRIDTRYGRIWKTNQHLVGDSCQIWQLDNDKTTYSCSTPAPSLEIAKEYFQRAKKVAENCLAEGWKVSQSTIKSGNGEKIEFKNNTSDLVVSTHYAENSHAYHKQWTVYYYIGAPKVH